MRLASAMVLGLMGVLGCNSEPTVTSSVSGGLACEYPAAPYGVAVGEVLGGQLAWEGHPPRSDEVGAVAVGELHDCDGAMGIHGLLFITVTASCIECVAHLEDLESGMPEWTDKGIRAVALVATSSQGPATVSDATTWKTAAGLDEVAVVADPNFSMVLANDVGYPNQVVVNPRSMQVVERRVGYDGTHEALENLASANAE